MEELEEFALDGVTYEAFNTSGGLGSMCETLNGKVRNLNYRTIRYPGHAAIMKALLNDLRLRDRRDVLKDILENALPATLQDVVIVFVTVSGKRNGPAGAGHLREQDLQRRDRRRHAQRDSDHDGGGHHWRPRSARDRQRSPTAALFARKISISMCSSRIASGAPTRPAHKFQEGRRLRRRRFVAGIVMSDS